MRGCLDGGCPRGKHYLIPRSGRLDASSSAQCACGNRWPCEDAVEPGSSYDTGPGSCWSTHAEINAIMQSSWRDRKGAVMYVNTEPCTGCLKLIACSGIVRVTWPDGTLGFPFLSCYTRG